MRLKARIEKVERVVGARKAEPVLVLHRLFSPSEAGPIDEGIRYARINGRPDGLVARNDTEDEDAFVERMENLMGLNKGEKA